MLNKKGERELAYVVIINDVTPIEGYDRVELAHVDGWTVVVGKDEFHAGDPAVYFEIDSQLPEKEPFTSMEFLAKKKFKVKTQKMCKSLSQGLLMSAESLGWTKFQDGMYRPDGTEYRASDESRFLTLVLGVTYAEPGDNTRKAAPADPYKVMAQRYPKIFSKPVIRRLMHYKWGRKLLLVFFGKKRNKRNWPAWVSRTDEERIQNMTWVLADKEPMIVTEKIDGTSTTFSLKKKYFGTEFYVCSRNVVFDKPDKKCFYDTNVYVEMAEKYDIEKKMKAMMKDLGVDWLTIQGETFGAGIQSRNYGLGGHDFKAFNFVTPKEGRWGTTVAAEYLGKYGIPFVPILDTEYVLPDTIEQMLAYADGKSTIDGEMREGVVIRSFNGKRSFKAVSNEYLLKHHS